MRPGDLKPSLPTGKVRGLLLTWTLVDLVLVFNSFLFSFSPHCHFHFHFHFRFHFHSTPFHSVSLILHSYSTLFHSIPHHSTLFHSHPHTLTPHQHGTGAARNGRDLGGHPVLLRPHAVLFPRHKFVVLPKHPAPQPLEPVRARRACFDGVAVGW